MIIQDSELGEILLKKHATARRIIFRFKTGRIEATMPTYATKKEVQQVIEGHKSKLKMMMKKSPSGSLREGSVIETKFFKICIQCAERENFLFHFTGETLMIDCPKETDFETSEVTTLLISGIADRLRKDAQRYLPIRLKELADRLSVKYSDVKIAHGKKRLGKCDTRKVIWLSYYLMFLPDRLIDYVLLHELAHLTEMNHGERFHQLCNHYMNGKERELQRELKAFPFPII